ncbi:MAG: F0F1 ATP synthase subunit delta [Desulfurivibrionaceae bacterium]|nr:F0F1 ATP synthase subunit delta [Desulfurivibrionaceae bacterium]
MLIDWFTISAQILNFLILVWLLKRFLYRPILDALDAREKRVASSLAEAEAKKEEARKERNEFQEKNQTFAKERDGLFRKATEEAQAERQRLLEEARQAAMSLRQQQEEAVREEERSLYESISRRTRREVFAIARKALSDLAGATLEERLVDVFIRRLRALKEKEKGDLLSVLKESSAPVVVRTSVDLSADQAEATEEAIQEIVGRELEIRFETAPDLITGIELTANGQKVAWSIAGYLSSLEQGLAELLKEKAKPAGGAESQASGP